MIREVIALIKLRIAIVLANKTLLTQLFLPLILIVLYHFMYNQDGQDPQIVVLLGMLMVHANAGQLMSLIMSEEQEKHNARSLQLVGVKPSLYLIANAVLPLALTLVYMLGLQVVLKADFSGYWLGYWLVNTLTALVFLVIYLTIGVVCDTQSKATIASLPVMLSAIVLPIVGQMNASLEHMAQYSFLSAYIEWMKQGGKYNVNDWHLLVVLAWLVGLLLVICVTYQKNQKRS